MNSHSIKFNDRDWAALRKAARARGGTVGALVNSVLAEYMQREYGHAWAGGDTWGGDRISGRLSTIYIDVANCRARVARAGVGDSPEFAANWETLEDEAAAAVEAAGGHVTMSAIYECPRELAQKATWK